MGVLAMLYLPQLHRLRDRTIRRLGVRLLVDRLQRRHVRPATSKRAVLRGVALAGGRPPAAVGVPERPVLLLNLGEPLGFPQPLARELVADAEQGHRPNRPRERLE